MSSTIDFRITVPRTLTEASTELARAGAREGAVLALQQQGDLTIREAAAELGLTYEAYLDLLAARGLPASNDMDDAATLQLL